MRRGGAKGGERGRGVPHGGYSRSPGFSARTIAVRHRRNGFPAAKVNSGNSAIRTMHWRRNVRGESARSYFRNNFSNARARARALC